MRRGAAVAARGPRHHRSRRGGDLPGVRGPGTSGQPSVELDDYAHGQPDRPAAAHLAPYQARPGRRVLVIDSLADLHGPTAGTVELPLRLFWSLPDHRFNLDDPDMRLWYYQTVLREASRVEDLTTYLHAATLVRAGRYPLSDGYRTVTGGVTGEPRWA